MAEEIIIRILNSENSKPPSGKTGEEGKTDKNAGEIILGTGKSLKNEFLEGHKENGPKFILGLEAAKHNIALAANSIFSRYTTLSEDYKAGQRYNNIKSVVNKASGLIQSTTAGFMIGGLLGAVIGASSNILSQAINHTNVMSQYYQQLNTMDYNTEFGKIRAGLIDGGRGTEN